MTLKWRLGGDRKHTAIKHNKQIQKSPIMKQNTFPKHNNETASFTTNIYLKTRNISTQHNIPFQLFLNNTNHSQKNKKYNNSHTHKHTSQQITTQIRPPTTKITYKPPPKQQKNPHPQPRLQNDANHQSPRTTITNARPPAYIVERQTNIQPKQKKTPQI